MPQLEDGYIRIATELWEALTKIRISGEARQIFDAIMRKTYGWQKKWDTISLSQLEKMTAIKQPNIIRARKKLLDMNLIIIKKDNEDNVSYCIQKNYHKWKPLSKKITLSKKIIAVIKKDNESLSKKIDTKNTITKDTITKDKYVETSTEFQLSKLLLNLILKRDSNYKKPDLQEWSKHIDYLIRIDGRKPERIKKVIKWCQSDDFWQNNILSTKKLRKQFNQLNLKLKKEEEYI